MQKFVTLFMFVCLATVLAWTALHAADNAASEAAAPQTEAADSKVRESESTAEFGLLAIGVGLTMFGGAIATGLAQKSIGTAVVAACAENRSFLGIGVFLLALPETILIIATGIAYLLLQHIR
jgi:V/A-type H+-transporting ATPase subunit K